MQDIGKKGRIFVQKPAGIQVDVEVLDVKVSYGQNRWLVKPVSGAGECWVESVEILEPAS